MAERIRPNPYSNESRRGVLHKQEKITEVIQGILKLEEFSEAQGLLIRLDANPNLTIEQKIILLEQSVWDRDPNLEGNLAKQLKINPTKVLSNIDTIGDSPDLERFYSKLSEDESIITRVKRIASATPKQLVKKGLNIHTAAKYRVDLIRAGLASRVHRAKEPSPQTAELDDFVAETLKANPKISNQELAEKASETFKREINISKIKNAVFHVTNTREDVPKRQKRENKQTWSTSKESAKATEKDFLTALKNEEISHPGKPDLEKIAKDLELSLGYVRRLWNRVKKTKKTPVAK